MNLRVDLEKTGLSQEKINSKYDEAVKIANELRQDKEEFTGWVNCPKEVPDSLIFEIESTAKEVQSICESLIVVGIGGSYLGTAAIFEATGGKKEGYPELVFSGNTLNSAEMITALDIIKNKETCLCVVSKSGNTMETRIAYGILKKAIVEKYGESAKKRIIIITDSLKGNLRQEVNEFGYKSFEIPANIGGRYSAFTPSILFPLAVAGVNIKEFVCGAKDVSCDEKFWAEGIKYAVVRYLLEQQGKNMEVFEYFDPRQRLLGEWCKQLFAESEGKDGKGLFPVTLSFTTDLHSVGQYLQEGKQIFFETVINVENEDVDLIIPDEVGKSFGGRKLKEINDIAVESVIAVHFKENIPVVVLNILDNKEYSLGQLLYFFMMTAGVTGKLLGVNPFTQDGVEKYKSEIRKRFVK